MTDVRGHGEGTYFQRRSGKGRGSWVSMVTQRDGRRASRTTHSRDEAKAALVELLRLRDAGATMTGRVRLSDYLEAWTQRDHGWAPATARKHEAAVRVHLSPGIGGLRLSELSVADVDRLLGRLALGPQSARHIRSTLRRALADAQRDGLTTRNVAALARAPKLPHRERTILDAAQARVLIESTRGTRYGPLWTILVTTGLRISEALGLAWSDVTLGGDDDRPGAVGASDERLRAQGWSERMAERQPGDASTGLRSRRDDRGSVRGASFTVARQLAREDGEWVRRQPKTAKGRRTIPLTPLGVEALRAQREQQDADLGSTPRPIDGLVFTSERGNPLHGENTGKLLARDLEAAGLPRVTQHALRHSCATLLVAQGVPLPVVSRILGHSTIRVTIDLYTHAIPELSVEAARLMQEALA